MTSRVAKIPISLPKGTEVKMSGHKMSVKGKLGEMHHMVNPLVQIKISDNILQVIAANDSDEANTLAGTTRALAHNMVHGVSHGFEKKLELVGVGYRAKVQGNQVELAVGYSHPVSFQLPKGVTAETPSQTLVILKGANKQEVCQAAADIRRIRPPEPYKGKGIRYVNEQIVLKEVKKK